MTSEKQHIAECCDAWCKTKNMPTYSDLVTALSIMCANAVIGPDASMDGCTDCYHVPYDDVEAANALLAKLQEVRDA